MLLKIDDLYFCFLSNSSDCFDHIALMRERTDARNALTFYHHTRFSSESSVLALLGDAVRGIGSVNQNHQTVHLPELLHIYDR